jgi:hypothetical protein
MDLRLDNLCRRSWVLGTAVEVGLSRAWRIETTSTGDDARSYIVLGIGPQEWSNSASQEGLHGRDASDNNLDYRLK